MIRSATLMFWMATCSGIALLAPGRALAQGATLNLGQVEAGASPAGAAAPSATQSRAAAKALKKKAINLIQVQPQSEIRKLPDVNVAEALQRIPGISLETDTGEGRFINIRGLDADLNATTYDGIPLTASNQASPEGGSRAVAMDAFPAGVVGGIEVVDTPLPDMDADGLGGSVNLVPRSIEPNAKPFLDATFGGGFENLRNTAVWDASVTVGTSFGLMPQTYPWDPGRKADRPFTIVATYARYDDKRGIDDVEESYADTAGLPSKALTNIQERYYQGNRKRDGEAVTLGFQPDAENRYSVTLLDSGYTEQLDKHRLEIDGLDGSNGSFTTLANGSYEATGASASQVFTNSLEKIRNVLIAADGHNVVGGTTKIDYRVGFTQGSDQFPSNWGSTYSDPDSLDVIYNNSNGARETATAVGEDLTHASLYQFSSASNSTSKATDKEWSGWLDVTQPTSLGGVDGTIKAGAAALLRTRGVSQDETDYAANGTEDLSQFARGASQTYYDGLYHIGPNIANGPSQAYILANATASTNTIANLEAFQHDSEDIYAGYGQYSGVVGKFEGLAGVRVEATQGVFHANVGTTDSSGNTSVSPTLNRYRYVNVFPDVTAKATLRPNLLLRAGVTTAIARPGFDQITAARTVDYSQDTVSQGNPNLKPTTGIDFDLALERYLADGGIASINLFDKEFRNYIVSTTLNLNDYDGSGQTFVETSYKNIGGAFARGLELNYQQRYAGLPTPFDGLGVDANVTYVSSGGDIRAGQREPLPETSPRNFNLAGFYEKGRISARIASSYVSQDLFSVGGDRGTDVFASPRLRVDFETSYAVSPHLTLSFSAKNLTNTPLEFTESEDQNRPIQREFYDQTFLFLARVRL